MSEALRRQSFDAGQVSRLLGIPRRKLREWQRQGLVSAKDRFEFPDLVALKAIAQLKASRFRSDRIQRILSALRRKLANTDDPLSQVRIFTDGRRIFVRTDGAAMEPLSGQLLLDFDRAELGKLRAFPAVESAAAARKKRLAQQKESERWFHRGLELEQQGAPVEEVAAAYRKALEFDGQSVAALVNLGTAYFEAGRLREAASCYEQALRLDPDYALAHFDLGSVYDEMGDLLAAAKHYAAALRLDPNYADAHYNFALNCQTRGQYLAAMRHWRAYLKLDTASEWAAIARRELERLSRVTLVVNSKHSAADAPGR